MDTVETRHDERSFRAPITARSWTIEVGQTPKSRDTGVPAPGRMSPQRALASIIKLDATVRMDAQKRAVVTPSQESVVPKSQEYRSKTPPEFGHAMLEYFSFDPKYINLNNGENLIDQYLPPGASNMLKPPFSQGRSERRPGLYWTRAQN